MSFKSNTKTLSTKGKGRSLGKYTNVSRMEEESSTAPTATTNTQVDTNLTAIGIKPVKESQLPSQVNSESQKEQSPDYTYKP